MNDYSEKFRVDYPYGIIINLSNLKFSWFNRKYRKLRDNSNENLDYEEKYSFDNVLENDLLLEELKEFTSKHKEYGAKYLYQKVGEIQYLSIWLYNDVTIPYNHKGVKNQLMDGYLSRLKEISDLLKVYLNLNY